MKKSKSSSSKKADTFRSHYDFSNGVTGKHAAEYAKGTNLYFIDPDVMDVFPDGEVVNQTLRALAPLIRKRGAVTPVRDVPKRRTA